MNATTSVEYSSSEPREMYRDTIQRENIKSFKIYMGICTGVILLLTMMVFVFTYLSVDAEKKVSERST